VALKSEKQQAVLGLHRVREVTGEDAGAPSQSVAPGDWGICHRPRYLFRDPRWRVTLRQAGNLLSEPQGLCGAWTIAGSAARTHPDWGREYPDAGRLLPLAPIGAGKAQNALIAPQAALRCDR
jgi:hypothetical protein